MPKLLHVLENNPTVINHLAYTLGLDKKLAFHDVYSLTDPDLLAFVPRPVLALLVVIPMTPTWHDERTREDEGKTEYQGVGEQEPVIWFKQTIGNACGSIGLVHCVLNGDAARHILPGSTLEQIKNEALPKTIWDRARVLENSEAFEKAHEDAAMLGDSVVPTPEEGHRTGGHFVAFVKGKDGHLWEMEGGRKGPLDRGALAEDEDVLSPAALAKGLGKLIKNESEKGGDLRFSVTALAENLE